MKIKVCGMRAPDNIRAVAALGIDLMGFIFWERSPRNAVSLKLPPINSIKKVGIFVDEQPQNIIAKIGEYHLDYIQLHGKESAAYIDHLRNTIDANALRKDAQKIKIIKAISIHDADDIKLWRAYEGHADMLLFDTKCKCVGGSGQQFDWSVLEVYDGDLPFLLSGGIGPDDAERVKAFHHPRCIGIDLNSKFEDAPGLKNIEKLKNFINEIKDEQN